MKAQATKGFVIYWQYPTLGTRQRNTIAYASREDAERKADELRKDGMHVNSIGYRD